jgi:hypothetical protein
MRKPRVFIGSSSEAISIAIKIRKQLRDIANVVIWNEAPEFQINRSVLDGLLKSKDKYDFAIMVFNKDDALVTSKDETGGRNKALYVTRDNVLFELGLFMGWLGPDRTFFIYNTKDEVKIPSDFKGLVVARYTSHTGKLDEDITEATDEIRQQIEEQGPLPDLDRVQLEAGILSRIINAYIEPPYDYIYSDYSGIVRGQQPERINTMNDLVQLSKDLFLYYMLYYLYPLLPRQRMREMSLRIYYAYYLGDGVTWKFEAEPRDCIDRSDVTGEEFKGHFVIGLSNPNPSFNERRWYEGRVLPGYDDGYPQSICATAFMTGRAIPIPDTSETREPNYDVESEAAVFSVPVEWRLKGGSAKASVGVLGISSALPRSISPEIQRRTIGLANLLGFLFSMYAQNNEARLNTETEGLKLGGRPIGISRDAPEDFIRRAVVLRRKIAGHFETGFLKVTQSKVTHSLVDGKLTVNKTT